MGGGKECVLDLRGNETRWGLLWNMGIWVWICVGMDMWICVDMLGEKDGGGGEGEGGRWEGCGKGVGKGKWEMGNGKDTYGKW